MSSYVKISRFVKEISFWKDTSTFVFHKFPLPSIFYCPQPCSCPETLYAITSQSAPGGLCWPRICRTVIAVMLIRRCASFIYLLFFIFQNTLIPP